MHWKPAIIAALVTLVLLYIDKKVTHVFFAS